jgi:ubiquinone/menaquinone biosynthesis C-methylase UbiE
MTTARKKRKEGRWYLPGMLYDGILERPLDGIRKKVRELVEEEGLFPLIDICCGPGSQLGHLAPLSRPTFGLDINFRLMRYASARRPGIPFVCADASRLPFRAGAFKGAILSFALHEKQPETRLSILDAAASILAPGGRLVLLDFENPWDRKSRMAHLYVSVIERLAGTQHFRRNRDFLRRGGLRALLAESGLSEVRRLDVAAGSCAIVVAAP